MFGRANVPPSSNRRAPDQRSQSVGTLQLRVPGNTPNTNIYKVLAPSRRCLKTWLLLILSVYLFLVFVLSRSIELMNETSKAVSSSESSRVTGRQVDLDEFRLAYAYSLAPTTTHPSSSPGSSSHQPTELKTVRSSSLSNLTREDFDKIREPRLEMENGLDESKKHNYTEQTGSHAGKGLIKLVKAGTNNETGIQRANRFLKERHKTKPAPKYIPIYLNYRSNATAGPLFSDGIITHHPFHFTLSNQDACDNGGNHSNDVYVLILVKCRPGEKWDRMQIRRTWGGVTEVHGRRTLTMFLIGQTGNAVTDTGIAKEDAQYRDIIQENFIDSYYNMTHKNIMGLKWVHTHCSNAAFVLSIDADMMLSIYNLVLRMESSSTTNFSEGHLRVDPLPHRSNDSKWFTPKEVYPEPSYAPFLNGACYVMSGDVARLLYKESAHVRYLPWDDVYIGLVMKKINVVPKFSALYEQFISKRKALVKGIAVDIGHNKVTVNENMARLWETVHAGKGLLPAHRNRYNQTNLK